MAVHFCLFYILLFEHFYTNLSHVIANSHSSILRQNTYNDQEQIIVILAQEA
jgi:hypothetical protein